MTRGEEELVLDGSGMAGVYIVCSATAAVLNVVMVSSRCNGQPYLAPHVNTQS